MSRRRERCRRGRRGRQSSLDLFVRALSSFAFANNLATAKLVVNAHVVVPEQDMVDPQCVTREDVERRRVHSLPHGRKRTRIYQFLEKETRSASRSGVLGAHDSDRHVGDSVVTEFVLEQGYLVEKENRDVGPGEERQRDSGMSWRSLLPFEAPFRR